MFRSLYATANWIRDNRKETETTHIILFLGLGSAELTKWSIGVIRILNKSPC